MGVMLMSEKERHRKAIFEMVVQGRITLKKAAERCGLSYRQTLRIHQNYLSEGDAGLTHKSRGQRSNRKHPHQDAIINLYREKYEGFGPTLASEYLLEEGYLVNHETLRQWLLSEGLWHRQRKRNPYRRRREPKAQFGELIQIDGSIHDWFCSGKHDCLLNMIDDATGTTLSVLDTGETTHVIFTTLKKWIEKYGIPQAIYVDLKTVYVSPKEGNLSYFQQACEKLGIQVIKARSPQAKGRVERNHAVYQDRFVKALKLKHIKTIEGANRLLEKTFIDDLNQKFAKAPRNPNSAHAALMDIDLDQYLCWNYERRVHHDWTFSFKGKSYQVEKKHGELIKPKSIVQIRIHLNDKMSAWYKGNKITFTEITEPKLTKPLPKPKTNKVKSNGKAANSSHWGYSNAYLFEEPDKTKEKLAKMNREYNLKPPPKCD